MKILVTGANGWIGAALCERLTERAYRVRAAMRAKPQDGDEIDAIEVGEIDSTTDWTAALRDVQAIVHLAARVHVMKEPMRDALAEFRRVNVQGTLRLARQAVQMGVKRLIFVSSVKVNGETTAIGQKFTEADPPDPQDAYAISKMEAEQGLRQIAQASALQVVIVRPPLVYGAGVKANFAALMRAVQRGYPLPLANIRNRRSLLALDNLLDFLLVCLAHPAAANQTFLLNDGEDLSSADLVRRLGLASQRRTRLLPVPLWLLRLGAGVSGQTPALRRLSENLQVDATRAHQLLGWRPVVDVAEGLRRTVQRAARP